MKPRGEYIEWLCPDFHPPAQIHAFYGHCTRHETKNTGVDEYGDPVDLTEWKLRYAYARWVPTANGEDLRFTECEQGRGAFPVTILEEP